MQTVVRRAVRPRMERGRAKGGVGTVTCVLALLALAPLIATDVAITTDGPSHLFNAFSAVEVARGTPPFADWLTADGNVAPNRAAHVVLTGAGPLLGFERSERLLLAAAVLGTFLVLGFNAGSVALLPAVAWLAQGWFAWSGFYDFTISLIGFSLILVVLTRTRGVVRFGLVQVLLLLTLFAHFFTFAVALGMVAATTVRDALHGQRTPGSMLMPVPGAVVFALTVLGDTVKTGSFAAGNTLKAVAGIAIGDFVVSFHAVDVLAGVLIMIATWLAVRERVRSGVRGLEAAELFGIALLLGSVVAPDTIGEGSYIQARMRLLGVICLLPSTARWLAGLKPVVRRTFALALAVLLAVHAVLAVGMARRTRSDLSIVRSLLAASGAAEGHGYQTALRDHERGILRLSVYLHLGERAALERRLLVLDNYEATLAIFPVRWRSMPDLLQLNNRADTVDVRWSMGASRWEAPIHVLHESERALRTADPCIALGPTQTISPFAVTVARRQCAQPATTGDASVAAPAP